MTLTGFIASARKPGKTKVAGLLKAMGFQDKGSNAAQWVFGKTRFRVDVIDFREDLRDSEIYWAEEVGWDYNWAVRIAVNHRNRTDDNYILWHALLVALMEAMGSREVWLDGGSGIPQQPYTMRELFPELRSDEGEDLNEDPTDYGPVLVDAVEPLRSESPEILENYSSEPTPAPGPAPAPEDDLMPKEEAPSLVPLEAEADADDDDGWGDDDDDDWDDWGEDEDDGEDGEDDGEDDDAGVDVITDW